MIDVTLLKGGHGDARAASVVLARAFADSPVYTAVLADRTDSARARQGWV